MKNKTYKVYGPNAQVIQELNTIGELIEYLNKSDKKPELPEVMNSIPSVTNNPIIAAEKVKASPNKVILRKQTRT